MDDTCQQDIELLEKAFLMFGLAANDGEVERLIKAFLVPVTLKMNSEFKPVQDKAMELLSHITKRLQTRSQVQLPVNVLIEQLDGATPLVQNFILVYLRIGIPRLSPVNQIEMLPLLIKSMNNKTNKQMDSILLLYSGALIHLTVTDGAGLNSLVPPDGNMKEHYLRYQLTLLLIPYSYEGDLPPPGLTVSQYKQIVSDKPVDPDTLEKMKVAAIHLLSSELFPINEILIHLIIGSCDSRHSVYELCDKKLKHVRDYEDNAVIEKLYSLYLGTASEVKTVSGSAKTLTQRPANLRMKLKILSILNKSTVATDAFPSCVQVVFDGLFGDVSNVKLQLLSMEFILSIINKCLSTRLTVMAPLLLTALYKIIDNNDLKDNKLIVSAFSGLSCLSKKAPHVLRKDAKHLYKLFDELEKETNKDNILAIQECINSVSGVYVNESNEKNVTLLESILLTHINGKLVQSRKAAAYLAHSLFLFSHIPSCYVSLIACDDSQLEVREEGLNGLCPRQHESNPQFPPFANVIQYISSRVMMQCVCVYDDPLCVNIWRGFLSTLEENASNESDHEEDLPVTHLQLLLLVWGSFSDSVRKELLLKCVAAVNTVAQEKENYY